MKTRIGIPLAVLLVACACLVAAAVAWATALTLHAGFSPDRLGAPTNVSATARFESAMGGPPPPLANVTFYAPAGMAVDTRGLRRRHDEHDQDHDPLPAAPVGECGRRPACS